LASTLLASGIAFAQEAEAEEGGNDPAAWFRIDSDALGLQLWAGATNKVGPIDLATDIYVLDYQGSTFGEFDIGPAFSFGDLALLPMVGIGFDWGQQEPSVLVAPQLFTIYDGDPPIYFESWIQGFLTSPFADGGGNTLYTRDFALFKATPDFYVGAQVEATIGLNDAGKATDADGELKALVSLPVGLRVNYNAHGDWDALIGLFLGVETQKHAKQVGTGEFEEGIVLTEESKGIVGRFTYLHFF
jgi:hypothetical protein